MPACVYVFPRLALISSAGCHQPDQPDRASFRPGRCTPLAFISGFGAASLPTGTLQVPPVLSLQLSW